MIEEVEKEIIEILKHNLKEIKNVDIIRPDFKKDNLQAILPAISFENVEFKTEDLGIGFSSGAKKEGQQDKFKGDIKTTEFKLSKKPLKPLAIVECPPGTRKREIDDYTVDYEKGIINFRIPPEKGKDISIKYFINKSAAETKGLKLNLKYNLNIWAANEQERDKITMDVLKTLLTFTDVLSSKGIILRTIGGKNIDGDKIKDVFGKNIECNIETEIYVEIPYEIIKKIEIKEEIK